MLLDSPIARHLANALRCAANRPGFTVAVGFADGHLHGDEISPSGNDHDAENSLFANAPQEGST